LADSDVVVGLMSLVVEAVVVYVLSRSLSSLSRRWAVLVPAGIVVDPLTSPIPSVPARASGISRPGRSPPRTCSICGWVRRRLGVGPVR
jgi:hypothetical protein